MTFPSVDFPLYGLPTDLQLPGRLWNVEGELGAPTWGLWWWFGRVAEPTHGEAWVQVGCLPRERHAEVMTPRGGDPVREVAFAATFALTNATLPSETERPDGYLDEVVDFAGRRADGYERWTSVTWRVDGRAVPARLVRWAGAWAGFTTAAADVDLVAVGHGLDGAHLSLVELADTSALLVDHRPTIVVLVAVGHGLDGAHLSLVELADTSALHPDHGDVVTGS